MPEAPPEQVSFGPIIVMRALVPRAVLHVVGQDVREERGALALDQARAIFSSGLPSLSDLGSLGLVLFRGHRLQRPTQVPVVMPQRAHPPNPPRAIPLEHSSCLRSFGHYLLHCRRRGAHPVEEKPRLRKPEPIDPCSECLLQSCR